MKSFLLLPGLCATTAFAAAIGQYRRDSATSLPFNKIVAFGDDFTDNGEGSYAHGITGNPETGKGRMMWGNGTFTDGQVAVSYLSQDLNIPLTVDYAFGSSGGAQTIGSVCDTGLVKHSEVHTYAKLLSGRTVPSALDQVANYTGSSFASDISNTLHYFWTGNNDVIASLGWLGRFTICVNGECDPSADEFKSGLMKCLSTALNNLVDRGAKYILVPNIYPRHLAPWTTMWITQEEGMLANFNDVIDDVNRRLKSEIDRINSARGSQIMYYDANAWIKQAVQDTSMSGVQGGDNGYTNTCVDGCRIQATDKPNWDVWAHNTVGHGEPDDFFWMTEVVPSTTVMASIAQDMKAFLLAQQY